MARQPKTDNLRPVRTKEEARERGRAGGKKSGEARLEKKRWAEFHAAFLASEHDVKLDEKRTEHLGGQALLNAVFAKILSRGDSASVSLIKEMREAAEGSKATLSNPDGSPIIPSRVEFVVVDANADTNSATVRADNDTGKI